MIILDNIEKSNQIKSNQIKILFNSNKIKKI